MLGTGIEVPGRKAETIQHPNPCCAGCGIGSNLGDKSFAALKAEPSLYRMRRPETVVRIPVIMA